MPSFWRINVSLHGQHYFEIDNKFWSKESAVEMVRVLRKKFKAESGFKVTLTRWECSGRDYQVDLQTD